MKTIKLDSALLFALAIPFIMTYRISPGDTPLWLFGSIFLGLLSYIVLDLINISVKKYFNLKQIVLWFVIIATIGSAFASAIIVRHQTSPLYNIHDIVLQQEAAIRFFLDGKNPYSTPYFGTLLEEWNYSDKEVNPALFHFVMEPFYLLFSLPFYFFGNRLFGFFDGRMPLLFLFLILLVFAAALVKDKTKRLLFLILLAFNPAMLGYTLEGRSDIFMFAFLFGGLYFLTSKRLSLGGLLMGLAFAVKQSVWPILPFYFAFVYFNSKNILNTLKNLLPFILVFSLILLPFVIWDFKAFIESTVFYLSGASQHSYPISGYGLGKMLNQMGIIKDVHTYFPFHYFQIIIGVPLALVLINYLKKSPSVSRLILVYGIFLFVFWYLSRYFNNSHLGYLSMVFITAYFWPTKDLK